jgi:hypothetical protein
MWVEIGVEVKPRSGSCLRTYNFLISLLDSFSILLKVELTGCSCNQCSCKASIKSSLVEDFTIPLARRMKDW